MFAVQRQLVLLAAAGIATAVILFATYTSSLQDATTKALGYLRGAAGPTRKLHLLLPATGSTLNVCRFLLSNTITGYPEPILLGWGGHGQYDGAKSHLFKVSEGLAYLESKPQSNDDDLVLMLDAYDIWMLLRPEVIVSRYFDIIKQQNQRLEEDGLLGLEQGGEKVENTILFGADKICWPKDGRFAGCWAVPDSPMRAKAFGPDTDSWMVPNRPRWLNSGTIIGPLKHMRSLFNATMDSIHRNFDEGYQWRNSDQFYFSDVWGEQEISRMRLRDGVVRAPIVGYDENGPERGEVPVIPKGRQTEYHISLDYNIDIFQTAAGYNEYLTWMSFNHSTPTNLAPSSRRPRLDELQLPADILSSRPPFETSVKLSELPSEKGWKDVILGVSVPGQTVFPLFHLTGDKGYRDRWWHYVWFHPHGEALLAASAAPPKVNGPHVVTTVNGIQWIAANTSSNDSLPFAGRGGAWTDQGQHLSWNDLCGKWEKDLYV